LGYGGKEEGWFRAIQAAGPEAMRSYGKYLGRKFRDLPNIVWVLGGDYTPPEADRWTVDEVAAGIRETDPKHLMTGHGSPGQSAATAYPERKWLDVNVTYSYEPALHLPVRNDYQQQPVRPLVMLESTYENEHNATPEQIRRQAYWAMLSGACGQFFGNSPIWHFDGPGVAPTTRKWRTEIDGQGSRDMTVVRKLFSSLAWHRLAPDSESTVMVSGDDGKLGHATTAVTPEQDLSVTYVPATPGTEQRTVSVRLDRFRSPVRLRWFDPTSGRSVAVPNLPGKTEGEFTCRTPGLNGGGAGDWVLVIESSRAY
jgi:hypothetical protein